MSIHTHSVNRIVGFDLARAYAILGMFIVNFNFCFGSFGDTSQLGKFMNLFIGNSTAIFIVLAGMGISFLAKNAGSVYSEQKKIASAILKRSWFLVAIGLLLYTWWPGDILHFYGGYMHIAAFLLFIQPRYYLWLAILVILFFHLLLYIIPIDTAWNFETFKYEDFWTPAGFLRNTFYNGWNSIFPWFSYFLTGMFLGKINWQKKGVKPRVFGVGLILFLCFTTLRYFSRQQFFDDYWTTYILSEYFPAYIPFMMITLGFSLMMISTCMFLGDVFQNSFLTRVFTKTGQMTLTFYVLHITLGMILFSFLSGKIYTGYLTADIPVKPIFVLGFALGFYIVCVVFSWFWLKKFKYGPLEYCMRALSSR